MFARLIKTAAVASLVSGSIALGSMPAAAQEPQRTSATYQDWTLQCRLLRQAVATQADAANKEKKIEKAPLPPKTAKADNRVCEMVQRFTVRQTGRRFASLAIGRLPGEKEIKAVLQTPLVVYLPPGTSLKIGDKTTLKGAYVRCTPTTCLADIPLTKENLDQIAGGAKTTVEFTNLARRSISLPVSTRGFSGAMKAMLARGS